MTDKELIYNLRLIKCGLTAKQGTIDEAITKIKRIQQISDEANKVEFKSGYDGGFYHGLLRALEIWEGKSK